MSSQRTVRLQPTAPHRDVPAEATSERYKSISSGESAPADNTEVIDVSGSRRALVRVTFSSVTAATIKVYQQMRAETPVLWKTYTPGDFTVPYEVELDCTFEAGISVRITAITGTSAIREVFLSKEVAP